MANWAIWQNSVGVAANARGRRLACPPKPLHLLDPCEDVLQASQQRRIDIHEPQTPAPVSVEERLRARAGANPACGLRLAGRIDLEEMCEPRPQIGPVARRALVQPELDRLVGFEVVPAKRAKSETRM